MNILSLLLSFTLLGSGLEEFTDVLPEDDYRIVSLGGPTEVCPNTPVTYTAYVSGTCSSPQGFTYSWNSYGGGYTLVAGGTVYDNYITIKVSNVTNMSMVVIVNCSTQNLGSAAVQGIHVATLPSPTVSSVTSCDKGSVTLTATPPSGKTVRWYNLPEGGTLLATGNNFTTPYLDYSKTYYVSSFLATNGCDESPRVPIEAVILWRPSPPDVLGGARCGPGSVLLQASGGAAGIKWYRTSSGGNPELTTTGPTSSFNSTPLATQTGNYFVTSYTSGGCESTPRQPVTATIYTVSTPFPPGSTAVCTNGTAVLAASIESPQLNTIRWWDSAEGGTQLSSNQVTNLTSTAVFYAEGYYAPLGCISSTRVPLAVNVLPLPTPPTAVSGNERFEAGALSISASGSSSSTYAWYRPSDNALQYEGENSYLTPSVTTPSANYVYVKAKSADGCYSAPFWVDAVVYPKPVINSTGNRVSMGSSVTLSTSVGYNTYEWRKDGQIISSGTGATIDVNTPGNYTVTITKSPILGTSSSSPFRINSQLGGVDMNYVIDNTMLTGEVVSEDEIENLNSDSRSQTIKYLDEIGRPVQIVTTQGTPGKNDVVQPIVYDKLGREYRKYLPYAADEKTGIFKDNALTKQGSFYAPLGSMPFAETIFEPSPLNRVMKQGNPGSTGQPANQDILNLNDHTIKRRYEFNQENEVIYLSYEPSSGVISTKPGDYYALNHLHKVVTYGEKNYLTIEYTDKEGHMVCKKVQSSKPNEPLAFASTYYLYDDLGNLVVVLPPEGVEKLKTALNLN